MKKLVICMFLLFVFSIAANAVLPFPISAKVGLAGGALRVSAVVEKPCRNFLVNYELGYGFGNQYTLMSAGIAAKSFIKADTYVGLGLTYSSYSDLVTLSVAGNLADKAGFGLGAFVGKNIRESMYAQLGYDTRLGLVAEIGNNF
jgi:hypothetical protein